MKTIILFLFISLVSFGQELATAKSINNGIFIETAGPTRNYSSIRFSAYEKGEMADFDATQKQLVKIFRSQDSLKGLFLQKFLIRNGVDLNLLSQHQDSLIIKPDGIEYILKKKK